MKMIFSSSDPFYEVKMILFSGYLLFHALPFALAYFYIWLYSHICFRIQEL
jgi:hypothetical protein